MLQDADDNRAIVVTGPDANGVFTACVQHGTELAGKRVAAFCADSVQSIQVAAFPTETHAAVVSDLRVHARCGYVDVEAKLSSGTIAFAIGGNTYVGNGGTASLRLFYTDRVSQSATVVFWSNTNTQRTLPQQMSFKRPAWCVGSIDDAQVNWFVERGTQTLAVLVWMGACVALQGSVVTGLWKKRPRTLLLGTLGVLIAYIPCFHTASAADLLLSVYITTICSMLVFVGMMFYLFYPWRGWKRFRIPDMQHLHNAYCGVGIACGVWLVLQSITLLG
jgi:hypothetical protein